MNAIKKAFDYIVRSALILNNPYYFYGLPKADYTVRGRQILLKRLALEFERGEFESVIKGYPFAIKIVNQLDAKFSISHGELLVHIDDLVFRINSSEEIFIIYEIFVEGAYRYAGVSDSVFVDIGMNAGIATLFYARQTSVRKVYSFELFNPTFEFGKKNLEMNPQYASKVEANCYGLSDKETDVVLDYSPDRKGRMGLKGLPTDEQFPDNRKEHVIVKDVRHEFRRIIDESNPLDIIVKIDCEGEEYAIVESLWAAGLLSKLTIMMIEWHYRLPSVLEDQLKDSGFHVFSQTFPSLDSGMIYACRPMNRKEDR
jgi:FkbM family methyltransferase